MASSSIIPWRERAYVSVDEAGQILARSPVWVRRQILMGSLEAARVTESSPISVCVPSLIEFLDSIPPVDPATLKVTPPKLKLVVSR